jgi:phage terminase large subunit
MPDKSDEGWPSQLKLQEMVVWRNDTLDLFHRKRSFLDSAMAHYAEHPAHFISHWVDTIDPRLATSDAMVRMPFILFPRQRELMEFLHLCLKSEASCLIEKSRDMGATWVGCAFSIWLWLFHEGASVGWGSRKAPLVDRLGDLDSIFEKMRRILDTLPKIFMPRYESNYMKIVNLTNGASITGETGDDIGRGGRKLIYFKDESAHYEHPESIEAALSENTRVQVDISSVAGLGNVFHRRREAGIDWYPGQRVDPRRTNVFVLDWRDHPGKNQEWYDQRQQRFIDDGLLHIFRQEVDRDYAAAVENTINTGELD